MSFLLSATAKLNNEFSVDIVGGARLTGFSLLAYGGDALLVVGTNNDPLEGKRLLIEAGYSLYLVTVRGLLTSEPVEDESLRKLGVTSKVYDVTVVYG